MSADAAWVRPWRAAVGVAIAVVWGAIAWRGREIWPRIGHGGYLGDFVSIYMPQARLVAQGRPEVVSGWLYPPTLAVVLSPLAGFPAIVAQRVWEGILLASALGIAILARRAVGSWTALVLIATSAPVLDGWKWGQVSLPLGALALVALQRRDGLGAAAIGVGAAIKVYPVAWLLPDVVRPDRRRVGIALGVAAAVLVAASLLVPRGVLAPMFLAPWFEVGQRDYGAWGGQDLASWLQRLFVRGTVLDYRHAGPLLVALPPTIPPVAVNAVFRAVALGPLAFTAWRLRRGGDVRALLPALALAMSPGWTHAFAFLPATFAAGIARGGAAAKLAAAGATIGALPLVALVAAPMGWNAAAAWGATTVAAGLGWVALARK